MFTFGLFFYGPYQHWWYSLLNQYWPLKTSSHFLTKVCLCLCNTSLCFQHSIPRCVQHGLSLVSLFVFVATCTIRHLLLFASAGLSKPGGSWTPGDFSSFHMELNVTKQNICNSSENETGPCANYGEW